jgi:alpha-N-arabinofuranosidase
MFRSEANSFGNWIFAVFVLLVFSYAAPLAPAQEAKPPASVTATIEADQLKDPISKYDYGMFIEHIGNLINHGLWSEMLDDRKFYFPIKSADPSEAAQPGQSPQRLRMQSRKWHPVGPDQYVTMDKERPYVGEQSPQIKLEGATPHGIEQSGLALKKSKLYVGRIVLAATPGAKVKINLVWGAGAGERQTVTISNAHASFATFHFKFTAQADTTAARFEIVGAGSGSFSVGAVSLMPADNLQGFRPEVIGLLRQLNSGFWRMPGGNYISNYDWRDAIGDPDKRPTTWDHAWNAAQPNDVGIDELMVFCKLINVEPYVTVNAGLGDDHSAAELVEYANGSVQTRMGALRAHNGHPQPYHIKYWNIGNEPYGFWQIGFTPLRYWVIKHNLFAKAMRKADPSITILASGAMPDETTVNGISRMLTGKVQTEYGSEADWTGGVMANCWGNFDGVTEHFYARSGTRFDLSVSEHDNYHGGTRMPPRYGYVPVEQSLLEWARVPSNRLRIKAEEWQDYRRRFPAIDEKKIFLSLDEWAYTGTPINLKLALSYAMVMQEMFRHTEFLKMSAFTMGVSTLDSNATDAIFNTNGLMFKLYRDHFGSLPVAVTGNSPQPPPKWPVGGEQPRVNAGSPTYPLDVVAAYTADRKFLTIAVVNATEEAQSLNLDMQGARVTGKSQAWELTGPNVDAANVLGKIPQVRIMEKSLSDVPKTLTVDPISVNIYKFPAQ